MDYSNFNRVEITLSGQAEIDAFKNIVVLAVRQLQSSQVKDMQGTPLKSQAGLKGSDLVAAKLMIEKFAGQFGWDKPQLEPSADPDDIPKEVAELLEILRAAGADVQVTKVTL